MEKSREVFDRIGANLDPDGLCENLTVAEKQLVEIAKAVVREARILIMDEPSAALTNQEVDKLHELVEDMHVERLVSSMLLIVWRKLIDWRIER